MRVSSLTLLLSPLYRDGHSQPSTLFLDSFARKQIKPVSLGKGRGRPALPPTPPEELLNAGPFITVFSGHTPLLLVLLAHDDPIAALV